MHRYYGSTPQQSDRALLALATVGATCVILAALIGRWLEAGIVLASLLALLATRRWKGPLLGKPLLEVEDSTLSVRQLIYVPPKVVRLELAGLHRLIISGPTGDRRWRFVRVDGEQVELRPYFRCAEAGAIAFLKAQLPQLTLVEKAPAGFFEQVRGDYR